MMMIGLIEVFFLLFSISAATYQKFFVLPDHSVNDNCPFQPCATLGQYLLDDGSLPVISNVEYHFLPGDHHLPANMTLQYLCNFAIVGSEKLTSFPTVIIGDIQWYLQVLDSINVTIKNVIFNRPDIFAILYENYNSQLYNLAFIRCISCKLMGVKFIKSGFYGENLMGNSYLSNIIVSLVASPICCITVFNIVYTNNSSTNSYGEHTIRMDEIFISGETDDSVPSTGIRILMPPRFLNSVTCIISNSYFQNVDQATIFDINIYSCTASTLVQLDNCTFLHNLYY